MSIARTLADLLDTGGDIKTSHLDNVTPYSKPSTEPISYVSGLQAALDTKTTPSYVDTKVAALVDSSPATLDTLNELAAALGDDANHVTTMTNLIGTKLSLSGGTLTGNLEVGNLASAAVPLRLQTAAGPANTVRNQISMFTGGTNGYHISTVRASTSDDAAGLVFTQGTAERMRITSTGNVGIGTSSPTALLDLSVAQAKTVTSGASFITLGKTNEASNYAALLCEMKGGASQADRRWIFQTVEQGVANAGSIIFQPDGGNVGIGCSPTEKLHVQGDGADILLTDAAGGQTAKLGSTGSNNGLLELNNSAHTSMVFLNSSGDSWFKGGNVGIGQSSPASQLHLTDTSDVRLLFTTDTTSHTGNDGTFVGITGGNNFNIRQRENAPIDFYTNNQLRLKISNTGNVNIGGLPTTDSKLNVKGSIEVAPGTTGNTTGINTLLSSYGYNIGGTKYGQTAIGSHYDGPSNQGALVFSTTGGTISPVERMRITSTGNVLIGDGNAGTVTATTQADELVIESASEGGMTIMTPDAQSARIRITSPASNGTTNGAEIFYRQNIATMNVGINQTGGVLKLLSGTGVEALRLDANQNMGLGVTPDTFSSGYTALQLNGYAYNIAHSGGDHYITNNAYHNGGWKRGQASTAQKIQMASGKIQFDVASATAGGSGVDSPIAFTTAMTIANNGNVGIGTGTSTVYYPLTVEGNVDNWTSRIYNTHSSGLGLLARTDSTSSTALPFAVYTGSNYILKVNGAGNMGLGVTPESSLSSPVTFLGVGNRIGIYEYDDGGNPVQYNNTLNDRGDEKYKVNGYASRHQQRDGVHNFQVAPSGTAGNPIAFTTAMTIDNGGEVKFGNYQSDGSGQGCRIESISGSHPNISISATSTSSRDMMRFYNPNGNVGSIRTLNSGTLYNTGNGGGIDFSGQTGTGSGTVGDEVLDHYEEGTWTPTVSGSTTAGSYTVSVASSAYTKIGRQVTVQCEINYINTSGAGSGYLQISGLPFTTTGSHIGNVQANSGLDFPTDTFPTWYLTGTTSHFRCPRINKGTMFRIPVPTANTNYIYLRLTATYQTN